MLELNKYNKFCEEFTKYWDKIFEQSNKEKLDELASIRFFPKTLLEDLKIVFVKKEEELFDKDFAKYFETFGITQDGKYIFKDRWLIPIYNQYGKVNAIVGYSNTDKVRYLYAVNKYYNRSETLYGLENIDIAYDMDYAILVEGITDCIRIKELGFPNVFANCGTNENKFGMGILERFKYVIIIPDKDKAGGEALKRWQKHLRNTYIIALPQDHKDAGSMILEEDKTKLKNTIKSITTKKGNIAGTKTVLCK